MATLLQTVKYSRIAPLIKQACASENRDKSIDFTFLAEGFEVDYIIDEIAKTTQDKKCVDLSKNFKCIGFDEDTKDLTFIRNSYFVEVLTDYINNTKKQELINTLELLSATESILKKQNINVYIDKTNAATDEQLELFNDGQLMAINELMADIKEVGYMEIYFDDLSDFLDSFIPTKNRIVTSNVLDLFLDTIPKVVSKDIYFDKYSKKMLVSECADFLTRLSQYLTIDRFSNIDNVAEKMADDVLDCTTLQDYTSEDIKISFRRLVEGLDL